MTREDEVAAIKAALASLIAAIFDHRDNRPRADRGPIKATPFADIGAEMLMTRRQSSVAELANDPVGESLRRSVREIGKRVYELGGLSLMQEVADDVAEMDPNNFARRIDIMDKRWDGIGCEDGSVGWTA